MLVLLAGSLVLGLATARPALAGYGIQPAAGAQTGASPSYLVYLDGADSAAEIYVAATPQMDAFGFPAQRLGSCFPTRPFAEQNKYSCQPSSYSPTYDDTLSPGTYYWWLAFYRTDPGNNYPTRHLSGPFPFTVSPPTAPVNARPVRPADGAVVTSTPTFTVHAPAGATVATYVSDSPQRQSDGSPSGTEVDSCTVTVPSEGDYGCSVTDPLELTPGVAYHWWTVVRIDGSGWIYAPRSFSVRPAARVGTTEQGPKTAHAEKSASDAPYLRSDTHYRGVSVNDKRLGSAAYRLSRILGLPKTVAVACWSETDWASVSGANPENAYSILGFFNPEMPRWIQLSPAICRAMETLLYHRPLYPNVFTANSVDTLTHEMIHALGLHDEAKTECLAMQLTATTASTLGVPTAYSNSLGQLTLANYFKHPSRYVDVSRCREGGQWDIVPERRSLPWHNPG